MRHDIYWLHITHCIKFRVAFIMYQTCPYVVLIWNMSELFTHVSTRLSQYSFRSARSYQLFYLQVKSSSYGGHCIWSNRQELYLTTYAIRHYLWIVSRTLYFAHY